MGKTRFQIAISLDGFIAGPNQSQETPLGVGGEDLHEWIFNLAVWRRMHGMEGGEENASNAVLEEAQSNIGAYLMGRNMFGGGPGPWNPEKPWKGWWGDNPPYHTPVFVVTHHAREPLKMKSGTTFFFVTEGIESALDQAKNAASGRDVLIAGGANIFQQYFSAGLIDEFELHIVPLLLHDGERLLDNVGDVEVEQVRAIDAPGVTHIKYRVSQ